MTNNPYNELPHPVFLRYVAQNDYMIDGYYLPEGVRLNAVADAIEHIEALLREQTQKAIEAAFALREAKRERDEARREVCQLRSTSFPHDMKEVHEIADSRGWDCFETKEREEAMDRLIQLDEELGL
jgi:hypothetical protein